MMHSFSAQWARVAIPGTPWQRGAMNPAIRIRRAVDGDARALAVLAETTFRAAFADANTAANMSAHCAASYGEATQRLEIADPQRETWLAEAQGRLIAFVQLKPDSSSPLIPGERPLEIQRFYVDTAFHGTGLAHEVMAHVMARADQIGATVIWLGVWTENPKALAFYRKWQFEVIGEHVFMLGDDPQRDLVMRRDPRRGIFGLARSDLHVEGATQMVMNVRQMMETANAAVPRITVAEAQKMIADGNTLVVDVRDAPEIDKTGRIAGSVHISRGMLEFRADPDSPYHDKSLARNRTIIVYCASGGRAALAGKTLKDMGYEHVYNLGGFKDWTDAGGAVGS